MIQESTIPDFCLDRARIAEVHGLVDKLAGKNVKMAEMKDDFHFWVNAISSWTEFKVNKDIKFSFSNPKKLPLIKFIGKDTLYSDEIKEQDVETFFHELEEGFINNLQKILKRVDKAYKKALVFDQKDELLGSFVVSKIAQKTKEEHVFKVVEFDSASTDYFLREKKMFEGLRLHFLAWKENPSRSAFFYKDSWQNSICISVVESTRYTKGERSIIEGYLLHWRNYPVHVENFHPKFVLLPIMSLTGEPSKIPYTKYSKNVEEVQHIQIDEIIGKFVQHISTI